MVLNYHDSPPTFLASRPAWTLNGALIKTSEDRIGRITQTPFVWIEGAWETDVTIMPVEASECMHTIVIKARVTPETLRRWADVALNPFLEACAQLRDHWRRAKPDRVETLTWL